MFGLKPCTLTTNSKKSNNMFHHVQCKKHTWLIGLSSYWWLNQTLSFYFTLALIVRYLKMTFNGLHCTNNVNIYCVRVFL